MRMPEYGAKGSQKIYSINEGYAKYWDKATTAYVKEKKFPEVKIINQQKRIIFIDFISGQRKTIC
jgi:fructose-1,6-bisphosphatase